MLPSRFIQILLIFTTPLDLQSWSGNKSQEGMDATVMEIGGAGHHRGHLSFDLSYTPHWRLLILEELSLCSLPPCKKSVSQLISSFVVHSLFSA